jgi:hypothetical protein
MRSTSIRSHLQQMTIIKALHSSISIITIMMMMMMMMMMIIIILLQLLLLLKSLKNDHSGISRTIPNGIEENIDRIAGHFNADG